LPALRDATELAPVENINAELLSEKPLAVASVRRRQREAWTGERASRTAKRPVQARNNSSVLGGFGRLRFPLQFASLRFSLRSHLSISPNEKLPGDRITF